MQQPELIYDWNTLDQGAPLTTRPFTFWDETLRDGLQSPSIIDPPIEVKLRILHAQDALGIQHSDVGLPGAGPRAVADVTRLVQEIVSAKLKVRPACAARTHLADVRPIVEISQKTGLAIEVAAFIGSSPVRQLAEDWDLARMLKMTAEAVGFSVREGLPVLYVTEDTIRSRPDTLAALFRAAIDHGATRLCLCDTVGHATPDGVRNLVRFTRGLLRAWGAEQIGVDWHGHNDRGLGLINNLAALEAGADRIHGTMLGVGERVGNASLDQTLVNLRLLGVWGGPLDALAGYAQEVSVHYGVPIPASYPVVGRDAFRTATGVHAAAIIKAHKKGDTQLADLIYSGVPAAMVGREQLIEIGPMSGLSNVHFWLSRRGIEAQLGLAEHLLQAAKTSNRTLEEEELRALIAGF